MTTAGEVRIGDAERDRAVTALGEHYAAGRITKDEFDERSDQATKARYAAELTPLFTDLPVPAVPTRTVEHRPVRRPGPPPPFFFLVPVLVVGLAVTAIAAAPWLLWMVFMAALFMDPWGGRRHYRHRNWHHR